MKNKKHGLFTDRTGKTFVTNEGYKGEIIEYYGAFNCTIELEDGTILKNIRYEVAMDGRIKNPYHPSVFGVGCVGEGIHIKTINKKPTKAYSTWYEMVRRCYSEVYQSKFPTYKECVVIKEWLNFQIFADWFEENYVEGYELDKDILVKGNKVYSNETCAFVPREINYLFTKRQNCRGAYPIGVSKYESKFLASMTRNGISVGLGLHDTPEQAFKAYKRAKEKEIKETAKMSKDIVSEQVYKAMMNYKVEITD